MPTTDLCLKQAQTSVTQPDVKDLNIRKCLAPVMTTAVHHRLCKTYRLHFRQKGVRLSFMAAQHISSWQRKGLQPQEKLKSKQEAQQT